MKKYFIILYISIFIFFPKVAFSVLKNDYNFDISPLIEKPKMFSVGIGAIFREYNSWYNAGTLFTINPNSPNISRRDIYFTIMPYFEIRPLSFMEIGIAPTFTYQREDSRNNLNNATNKIDSFGFDSINAHIKFMAVKWYLSFGVRLDVNYSFLTRKLPYEKDIDRLNIAGTLMFAVIPKVIPLNLLINYTISTRDHIKTDITEIGEILGALEFITSKIITLYGGVVYVFPYTKRNKTTYIEPFVKFKASIGDFLLMNVTYRKVVWGDNYTPNDSTFSFGIEYMF